MRACGCHARAVSRQVHGIGRNDTEAGFRSSKVVFSVDDMALQTVGHQEKYIILTAVIEFYHLAHVLPN
jgi:hypothetical protein